MTLADWDADCIAKGCACDCHAGRTFCTCACRCLEAVPQSVAGEVGVRAGAGGVVMPVSLSIPVADAPARAEPPAIPHGRRDSQLGLGFEEMEWTRSMRSLEEHSHSIITAGAVEARLYRGDCVELMRRLPPGSIDLAFADPPYFLSNGGTTCSGGERVAVDKGKWDRSLGLFEDHQFHLAWLRAAQRVLKRSGSIWVSGTHHCIFSIGFAMQQLGFHVLNCVTWFKPNASPNQGCRQLTHSTEFVIWAAPHEYTPLEHTFNYDVLKAGNGDKQLRDMWQIPVTPAREKTHGTHPTQKPLELLRRIMKASARDGDWILDPFSGSGTTAQAALEAGANVIGMDLDPTYLDQTRARLLEWREPPDE